MEPCLLETALLGDVVDVGARLDAVRALEEVIAEQPMMWSSTTMTAR
jgi:hypothetical protein